MALAGGDDSVTGNELGEDATSGFNTESKRVDVNQKEVTHGLVAGKNTTLDSGTVCDSFIGVDSL